MLVLDAHDEDVGKLALDFGVLVRRKQFFEQSLLAARVGVAAFNRFFEFLYLHQLDVGSVLLAILEISGVMKEYDVQIEFLQNCALDHLLHAIEMNDSEPRPRQAGNSVIHLKNSPTYRTTVNQFGHVRHFLVAYSITVNMRPLIEHCPAVTPHLIEKTVFDLLQRVVPKVFEDAQ